MVTNKEIAGILNLTGQMLELHGENKFKARSYSNAAFRINRMDRQLRDVQAEDYERIDGIGKNLAPKIREIVETGNLAYLQQFLDKTPPGIVEIMSLKGIGPGKVRALWDGLQIESLGELLYACNENRLVDLKGFGEKTQDQIRKAIEFKMKNRGSYHYASVETFAMEWLKEIEKRPGVVAASLVGQMARKCQVVNKIQILAATNKPIALHQVPDEIELVLHTCGPDDFVWERFRLSATASHLENLKELKPEKYGSEEEIYHSIKMPFVPVEMREGHRELDWALRYTAEDIVKKDDLKGCLHNHSTWSDGLNTIEEMARGCMERGLSYFGICDHSRSAYYANGLTEDRIILQHAEIEALNEKLTPFRIFKGIESDILNDGRLDYPDEVLATFDFVVASVHSNLKMDESKATARLLRAIENPYTTILGHPTGRLLLSREGYPIDHRKIIDACAANGVAIELNANPMRLDLDWTFIYDAVERGVPVSINPDAHSVGRIDDMRFGVNVARKAGLPKDFALNAKSLEEITIYFERQKSKRP